MARIFKWTAARLRSDSVVALLDRGLSADDMKKHNPLNEWYRGGLFKPDAYVDMVIASRTAPN